MKLKSFLFFILSALLLSFSQAQDLRIGLRGGLNISSFVGEDADDANLKAGLHVGPYVKLGINDMFFLQPELLLSMKGYSEKGSVAGTDFKFRQNVTYLDLPLQLGISFTENFHILTGLQPSFLLGAKEKIKYDEENAVHQNDKDNNSEDFANVDLGLILGFQYAMESGLDLGFRFTYGFPNVFDDEDPEAHNLNLMLTVGYSISK